MSTEVHVTESSTRGARRNETGELPGPAGANGRGHDPDPLVGARAAEAHLADHSAEYQADVDADDAPYRQVSRSAVLGVLLAMFGWLGLLFAPLLVLALAGGVLGAFALRAIRRYPLELSGAGAAKVAMALGFAGFLAGVVTHGVIYVVELPKGHQRLAWAELQPEKKRPDLPVSPRSLELDGQRVFVKGYVHPGVSGSGGVRSFVLVPDMGTCCFGGQPKLTDMIEVTLHEPLLIEYSTYQRKLGGVLRVDTRLKEVPGGLQGGLYRLEADYLR